MKPSEIEDAYPLSPLQQGMLLHGLAAPSSCAYVEQLIVRWNEKVDFSVFKLAFDKIVRRHGILRTRFCVAGPDTPFQEVCREAVNWNFQDWACLPAAQREKNFDEFVSSDRRQKFDPAECPLFRVAFFKFGESSYRFLWTFHHALLDGRSGKIVTRELFDFYDGLSRGEKVPTEQPRPYGDYIRWLAKEDFIASKSYWQQMLKGISVSTPLTIGGARTNGPSFEVEKISLPTEMTDSLRNLSLKHDLTLNTLVQGAWAQIMARCSGEQDIVFGTIRAARSGAIDGLDRMVGLFMNTVPMRAHVQPEILLLDFLKSLRSEWIAMRPHERTPLATIHQWSGIPRESPLFSSLLVFEHCSLAEQMRVLRPEWANREFIRPSATEYPLTLAVFSEPTLQLKIRYDTTRFDRAAICGMLDGLQTLLENTEADLDQPLKKRSLLNEAAKEQVLVEWNDTERVFPDEACLHVLFERQATRSSALPAVIADDRELTYAQLNSQANQLAHYLLRAGVGRGSIVAIYLKRSPEVVVAMLAAMKAGGAWLVIDAATASSRLEFILKDAKPSALVTLQTLASPSKDHGVREIYLDAHGGEIARENTENPRVEVGLDDPAYAVYTSGSTGQPKGILLRHRGMINYVLFAIDRYEITSRDRRLQFVSISSDVVVADLFHCLLAGGATVLRPEQNFTFLQHFLRFLDDKRVTIVGLPSAYWHEWVELLGQQEQPVFPASLRIVISSMDRVRPDLFAIWKKKVNQRIRWFNAYGPSETSVAATVYEGDLSNEEFLSSVPVGRPIPNCQTYILDPHLNPMPVGIPGEIYIGGRGVALGYINRPDQTRERFLRNPFRANAEDIFYRTGDFGRYLPDGNIEFHGRRDNQVKIRGYRVELGEIEFALSSHPAVKECAVVVQRNEAGFDSLAGFVVLAPNQIFETYSFRDFLQEKLPHYMVPSSFTLLDSLPVTANGKIDRQTLVKTKVESDSREDSKTPETTAEKTIASIWRQVLGLEWVGVHDNFFELGGDSLRVVRLLTAMAELFQKELPMHLFLQDPTIAGLARQLEREEQPNGSAIVTLRRGGDKPPIIFLHLIDGDVLYVSGIARHLALDQPVYAIQPAGRNGSAQFDVTIEKIAAAYVKEIQNLWPTGPFVLAGFSWGTRVAHEMACQLAELGRREVSLIVIDTPPSYAIPRLSLLDSIRLAPSFFRNVPNWIRDDLALSSFEAMAFRLRKKIRRLARYAAHSVGAKRSSVLSLEPEDFSEIGYLPSEKQALHRLHWRATQTHVSRPYSGRITLFRARSRPLFHSLRADLNWHDFALGGLEIIPVPGIHDALVKRHVKALAETLQRWLDQSWMPWE